ncbi:MAG: hypothetical protein QXX74_03620, partial [Candidatus Micrarchaeaceae archaeon]
AGHGFYTDVPLHLFSQPHHRTIAIKCMNIKIFIAIAVVFRMLIFKCYSSEYKLNPLAAVRVVAKSHMPHCVLD